MKELERTLVSDGAAAAPDAILEGIGEDIAHREIAGSPRTIYSELWHIIYWQQMTLEWIAGLETPYPAAPEVGFPTEQQTENETWAELCHRFFAGLEQAGAAARDARKLEQLIRCTSAPGEPIRTMTVREQLESLAAHNAYHFGRIVLLRQIAGARPPA